MSNAADKREIQSKALGAAFLAHQVSQLEKSVDTLTFSRDGRINGTNARGRGGKGRGGAAGGKGSKGGAVKREIRVVDASTLVHALPVLKRWVREDRYQLVVPLSALSTLDILKRAPPPLHDLARDATRFLETQLNIARQIQSVWTGAEADVRIRFRAQASKEELPWNEVEKLFKVPEGYKVELPKDENGQEIEIPVAEEGEEPFEIPLPTANDIPRHLRSTLQCVLYFQRRTTPSPTSKSTKPISPVVLYNSLLSVPQPTPAALLALLPSPISTHSSRIQPTTNPPPDFLSLSSGDTLDYYLQTFFPDVSSTYAIPSSEILAATEWLKSQAKQHAQEKGNQQLQSSLSSGKNAPSRGRGGGRGGVGGRGRGGRNEGGGNGGNSKTGMLNEGGTARTLFVP